MDKKLPADSPLREDPCALQAWLHDADPSANIAWTVTHADGSQSSYSKPAPEGMEIEERAVACTDDLCPRCRKEAS